MKIISSILVAVAMFASSAAQAQVFTDNFSDGVIGQFWQLMDNSSTVSITETSGRIQFASTPASGDPIGDFRVAGYAAKNWRLLTTSDIQAKVKFYSYPQGAGSADESQAGIGISMYTEGAVISQAGLVPGIVIGLGQIRIIGYSPPLLRFIAADTVYSDGSWSTINQFVSTSAPFTSFIDPYNPQGGIVAQIPISGTIYLTYLTSTDQLKVSVIGFNDPDSFYIANATLGRHLPVQLALGGFANNSSTLSGTNAWFDDFEVTSGVMNAAPVAPSASQGTFSDRVRVSWTPGRGCTSHKIYRSISGQSEAFITTVGSTVTSYDDLALPVGVSASYRIEAIFSGGLPAFSAVSSLGWRAPPAPTGVSASDGTSTLHVTVTWAAATGATGYQIFRSGTVAAIGTVGAVLTYSDTTAVAGTSYTYTVKATGALGVSAASVGNTGYRQLTAPLSVAATDGTLTTGVTVTWAASTGATGYQIFRSGTVAAIGTVGAVLTYSDTTAVAGTSYTYTVKATGAVGVSAASVGNTGYRNRAAPTNCVASDNDTTKVRVTWTLAAAGTPAGTGYEVGRRIVGGTLLVLTTPPLSATTVQYDDMTAVPGTVYTYEVRAKYVLIGSSPATTVATLPTIDSGLRPTGATGGGDGGIAGGPESSTSLPGGSGHEGGESEPFAGGSGNSQNESTDPTGESADTPSEDGDIPDFCTTVALNLGGQIDTLEAELASHGDDPETAITQNLLKSMRALLVAGIDNELVVCAMARGDVTLDGAINDDDLATFLESWLACDLVGADLNRDGRITNDDLAIVLSAIDEANAKDNPETQSPETQSR